MITGVLFLLLALLALLLAAFIYQIASTPVPAVDAPHAHQARGGGACAGPGAASQAATRPHLPRHRAGT